MSSPFFPQLRYRIQERIQENPRMFTWKLVPDGAPRFEFRAGQFVMVNPIGAPGVKDGRAISLASSPLDLTLDLTIKVQGAWTNAMAALKSGEYVLLKGPYGVFTLDESIQTAVLLAGGIGITPYRSMIRLILARRLPTRVVLWYSNKTVEDRVYTEELEAWADQGIRIQETLTQVEVAPPGFIRGRITGDLLTRTTKEHAQSSYFVCGSPDFVTMMRALLHTLQIPDTMIRYERFTGIENGK